MRLERLIGKIYVMLETLNFVSKAMGSLEWEGKIFFYFFIEVQLICNYEFLVYSNII